MGVQMNDIRTFLERSVAWPKPEEEGFISLHTSDDWTGIATRTVEEFLKELDIARERATDIYICTGRQMKAKPNGGAHMVPIRKGINTDLYHAIWLDWDAGPDKQFKTQEEATAGLKKFLGDSGLPGPSAVVASGSGGYHLWWWSDRPLVKGVWAIYAQGLKNLVEQHGLDLDLGCTTDLVRILRVPQTFNHKHQPPKPVTLMGMGKTYDFSTELAMLAVTSDAKAPQRGLAPLPAGGLPIPTRFKGRTDAIVVKDEQLPATGFPPMPAEELRQCLDRIPNDKVSWERWNTIGMRAFAACDGEGYGLAEWRRWSDQLVSDGRDSCDDRWNTYHTSPPTRTGAGALVKEVRRITGDERWMPARAAPAKQLTKAMVNDQTGWNLPPNFRLMNKKIEMYLAPKKGEEPEEGEEDDPEKRWIPFIRSEIVERPWAQSDSAAGIMLKIRTDVERTFEAFIPRVEFSRAKIMQRMHHQNIWFNARIQPVVYEEFFMSWIGQMNTFAAANEKSSFGWEWKDPDNRLPTAFVYGGYRYRNNGTKEPVGAVDAKMRNEYYPQGKRQAWDDAAKVIFGQKRPGLEIIVAASLAGPLVQFTGEAGCMMSVYSIGTGAHKSTASKLGAAIFGHPLESRETKGSSHKGALKRAGDIRHLTIQFDDLQDDKDLLTAVNTVLQLHQGGEGTKLRQNRDYAASGSWNTFQLTLANQSVVDFMIKREPNSGAQVSRVFEVYHQKRPWDETGLIDEGLATRLIGDLSRNFGQVGVQYAELLANNTAEIDALLQKEMASFRAATAEKGIPHDSGNRYWIFTCTTLLTAVKLGLEMGIPFDYDGVREMLVESFVENCTKRTDEAVEGEGPRNSEMALTDYLNKYCPEYGLWSFNSAKRGGNKDDQIKLLSTPAHDKREIHIHLITDQRLIRISRKEFTKALLLEKRNIGTVVRGLEKHFNADASHSYQLASGSAYRRSQERVVEIPVPEGSPWEGVLFAHGGRTDEQL